MIRARARPSTRLAVRPVFTLNDLAFPIWEIWDAIVGLAEYARRSGTYSVGSKGWVDFRRTDNGIDYGNKHNATYQDKKGMRHPAHPLLREYHLLDP